MTGKPTMQDRLAAEAAQYLDVVEAFAAIDADPHASARRRAALARASEPKRRATASRRRHRFRH
jgi:hypothetical protein